MNNDEVSKFFEMFERRPTRLDLLPGCYPSPPGSIHDQIPVNISQILRAFDQTLPQPYCNEESSGCHISPQPSTKVTPTQSPIPFHMMNSGYFPARETRERCSMESKENQYAKMLNKISELERELCQTQADLVESQTIISRLEQQNVSLLKSKNNEKRIDLNKSQTEMREKCQEAVEKAEQLQKLLDKSVMKQNEMQLQINKQTTAYAEQMSAMEEKLTNAELKRKYEEEELKHEDSIKKASINKRLEQIAETKIMDRHVPTDQFTLTDEQLTKHKDKDLREGHPNCKIFKHDEEMQQMTMLGRETCKYRSQQIPRHNTVSRSSKNNKKIKEDGLERLLWQTKEDLIKNRAVASASKLDHRRLLLNISRTDKCKQLDISQNEIRFNGRDSVQTTEEFQKQLDNTTKVQDEIQLIEVEVPNDTVCDDILSPHHAKSLRMLETLPIPRIELSRKDNIMATVPFNQAEQADTKVKNQTSKYDIGNLVTIRVGKNRRNYAKKMCLLKNRKQKNKERVSQGLEPINFRPKKRRLQIV